MRQQIEKKALDLIHRNDSDPNPELVASLIDSVITDGLVDGDRLGLGRHGGKPLVATVTDGRVVFAHDGVQTGEMRIAQLGETELVTLLGRKVYQQYQRAFVSARG